MEMMIDRTSYRRSNVKCQEPVKPAKSRIKVLILNQIIISMAIIISVLIIKLCNFETSYNWLVEEINNGIPYKVLYELTNTKINEIKLFFDGEVSRKNDVDEAENQGEVVSPSGEEMTNLNSTELSGDDISLNVIPKYETAVEGINQMVDDANYIKNNYSIQTPLNGTITSIFGARTSDNPIVSSYHTGLDIAAKTGTTIVAAHDGEVIEASTISGYGKCVMIKQGELLTVYAHCSSLNVKKGEVVKKGSKIGEVGMTGNATGPHLHFEVRYNGRFVNPEDII